MANAWKDSRLFVNDGGTDILVHYETDTKNIVDFVEAVNNLIHSAQSDTSFTGTTTFENIHVTGTSQLDGTVTCGDNIIFNDNMNISDGNIYSQENDIMINANDKSYINLNRKGGWEIYSTKNNVSSTLAVNPENGTLSYDKKVEIGGGLKVSGTVDSPIKLPYTNISSDHLTTTISTPSGGKLILPNGDSAIQITTKSGKIFKIENNGTAYIDGKQLLTKTEMMQLEHPVGSAYITFTDTNPATILGIGTWQKVGTGYKLGIVGSVKDKNGTAHNTVAGNNTDGEWTHANSLAEIAVHSHSASCSSVGNHAHTRGSMNITGWFGCDDKTTTTYGGAFYDGGWGYDTGSQRSETGNIFRFDASRAWTGETSYNGSHGHTVSVGNAGSGARHNNIEPAFGIYLWKRTA